jgi:hypothetical protein
MNLVRLCEKQNSQNIWSVFGVVAQVIRWLSGDKVAQVIRWLSGDEVAQVIRWLSGDEVAQWG